MIDHQSFPYAGQRMTSQRENLGANHKDRPSQGRVAKTLEIDYKLRVQSHGAPRNRSQSVLEPNAGSLAKPWQKTYKIGTLWPIPAIFPNLFPLHLWSPLKSQRSSPLCHLIKVLEISFLRFFDIVAFTCPVNLYSTWHSCPVYVSSLDIFLKNGYWLYSLSEIFLLWVPYHYVLTTQSPILSGFSVWKVCYLFKLIN
jgi:hypothetical protein